MLGGPTSQRLDYSAKVAFSLPLQSEIIRLWLALLEPRAREPRKPRYPKLPLQAKLPHGYGTKLWLLSRSEAKLVDGR